MKEENKYMKIKKGKKTSTFLVLPCKICTEKHIFMREIKKIVGIHFYLADKN